MDNEKGHNRPGHDGLFKLFLREPDTARDFLAVHLPADIRAQVRLDTLKLEPGSFVDQKLRELHSDVLYSVETAEGHAGYIYCLVEHQSTADRMMAWRMMRYSMAVMDAHLKKGNDTLPVVVPLLFYQGTVRPYPYSTDWMDCFDAPALAREVYSRPWPLVDVSVMEDSDLQSHRRMALLELVQRDIRHRDAASLLRDVVQLIRLAGNTRAQSLRPPVFSDIYQRSPEVTRSGRYTLVSVKSADAQREPLNQLIDITMPGQLVNSVGDGFRYLLFQSGYSLCGRYGADFAELLKRPLPAVQRKIGPMRLSEALQVVAGPAWRMSVDEVNREVCFVLRDAYLAQAKTTASATPTLKSSDTAGVYVSPETSRNPYTGVLPGKNAVPVVAGQLLTSKKDTAQKPVSEFLPVPALQLPATSVKSVGAPVSATAPAPRNPFTGENLTGTTMPVPASPSPVGGKPDVSTPAPSTATPVKPATATAAVAKPLTGTPVTVVASGPEWKAVAGSTLKESLTDWAGKADCASGGHWVVIWQTSTDYRIDAPLVFKGNFESALVQVFDLYKKADKPLFAEASRLQCLVSVTDKPADRS